MDSEVFWEVYEAHLKLLHICSGKTLLVLAEKMGEEGCGLQGRVLGAMLMFLLPYPD